MNCFECGELASMEHHVVPQSRGGTKTVPLCGECHGKAHHTDRNMDTSRLVREGLARARARGVRLGSPNARLVARIGNAANSARAEAYASRVRPIAQALREQGWTLQDIGWALMAYGVPVTRYGRRWSPTAVMRLLA